MFRVSLLYKTCKSKGAKSPSHGQPCGATCGVEGLPEAITRRVKLPGFL